MTDPSTCTVQIGHLLNEARKALAAQEWNDLGDVLLRIKSQAHEGAWLALRLSAAQLKPAESAPPKVSIG